MPASPRADGRANNELRTLRFEPNFLDHPAGSVVIHAGSTRVLCTASFEDSVPRWLRDQGRGWLTAEYAMLPASTHSRSRRETSRPRGRTQEIQRLIGRSLRACLDFEKLGERSFTIDCDVLQADGGTRTASITGGFVALALACAKLIDQNILQTSPLIRSIAAVSCGIIEGEPRLDLPYEEDVRAEVDMNLVMTGRGDVVEIQATAEDGVLSRPHLDALIDIGATGCLELTRLQHQILADIPALAPLFEHLNNA